jgi:glutamyl-tRNA synthetase
MHANSAVADMAKQAKGRFAPSPTGDLHLGGAWTALVALCMPVTRVMRIDDLDAPRNVPGAEARILEDLAWLGLSWDELVRQSDRLDVYRSALNELSALGLTYFCDCSRAEIARSASAPHAGEDAVYTGTCRNKANKRDFRRPPAVRLRIPENTVVRFFDCQTVGGSQTLDANTAEAALNLASHIDRDAGDFVLVRGDGVFSYQFTTAVDDGTMQLTHIVRGRDLLGSTARQIFLIETLKLPRPEAYVHLPLVVGLDGERLAKRLQSATIRDLRTAGVAPNLIVGKLAQALGIAPTGTADGALLGAEEVRSWLANAACALKMQPFSLPAKWC